MNFDVIWSHPAEHDLRRLSPDVARRVVQGVDQLAATGLGDVRPLQGRERQWRLRVGDWRVIFTYDIDATAIRIIRVLPRGRAYRD